MTQKRQNLVGGSKTSANANNGDTEPTSSSSGKTSNPSTAPVLQKEDPGNIQDGTGNPDGVLKSWKPVRNPLNELFQPTYHFSFYLDSDILAEQGTGKEFVIAETGLTGMNIQDVNIDAFVGANIRTRNATATNIEIKIYEPMGAMFPDLLFQAAVQKGIRNYLKAPWFLKLKFHGYDELGHPQSVGNGWLWQLTLIDIQSQISENGAIHTVTAMPLSEQALNNQYCMIPDVSKITGTTVGQALQAAITNMNNGVKNKYGDTHPPFIEYAIEDRPYPYDTKVGITKPFDHRITSSVEPLSTFRSSDDYGVQTGQFAPGTDIPSIIDALMSRSETAVQMIRNSRELPPTNGPDEEKTIRDVSSIFHRIDTKVEYTGYDVTMGDYTKKITYIVKPYSSLRILTSMGRALAFDTEKSLTKKKASHAIQHSFMKKQYDYIFTGLNTEVERFDINVNFRWAVSVPHLQGWANSGTSARVDLTKSAADHQLRLNSENQTLDAINAEIADIDKRREEAKASGSAQEEQINKETEARRAELIASRTSSEGTIGGLRNVLGREKDALNLAATKANETARKAFPQRRVIDGEDTVYENARSEGKGYNGAGAGGKSYLPVSLFQDGNNPSSDTRVGTNTDNNANKSVYGTLLNQLYGSMDGNLQSLELEIKGDPYWLGPGNTGQIYDDNNSDDIPNFMNGEQIFVFRFKLPLGIDNVTGTVNLPQSAQDTGKGGSSSSGENNEKQNPGGSSNIFTGFYAAVQVTHHFREGRFTQTLSGTRIPGWYYENIIEGREIDTAEDVNYSNSQAPRQYGVDGAAPRATGGPSNIPTNIDERTLLALTLVAEAGGEGSRGMQAVGNVISNRVTTGRGPGNSISGVIMAPSQFSCWNDVTPESYLAKIRASGSGSSRDQTFQEAYRIAGSIMNGSASDITGGATSYYNPKKASPSWGNMGTTTVVIGNHKFKKGV